MTDLTHASRRPTYGIDAPGVVRNLALIGGACVVLAILLFFVLQPSLPALAHILLHTGLWPGVSFLLTAAVILWASLSGKFRERDRLLNAIPWRGDEIVLDVGC